MLRTEDTIFGTVRPGNGSYALMGNDGLTGSTGFAVLRPSHRRFRELVYLVAAAPDNIEWSAHRADGAAYPAVRPEIVSETEVAIPTAETSVLDRFSKTVSAILDRMGQPSGNPVTSPTSGMRCCRSWFLWSCYWRVTKKMTQHILYLFPDTNVFIQCKPLEQLDWSE